MKIFRLFALSLTILTVIQGWAQDVVPTIHPSVIYVKANGEETDSAQYAGSAPIVGRFYANPEDVGDYRASYEWRFRMQGEAEPYLIRYDEDTEYTFTSSGEHTIVLYATFINGTDTVAYKEDFWADPDMQPFSIVISESRLEMPNAFSPNDDDINDVYKAKRDWQSLVEFHAAIYNRWGQKLFEWDDPNDGWDGTFHGQPVKQGVYFVEVKAKGADGRKYHIRRDVNLLREHRDAEGSTGPSD